MNTETTQFLDLKITGFESDYVYQTIKKNSYFYEGDLLKKWTKYFSDSKTLLDIGANLGNHTLYWSKNLDGTQIYSFEPYKPNFELLEKNIQQNNLKNVFPINCAIGESKSKAKIKSFDESNYGATTFEKDDDSDDGIEVIDIDTFIKEKNIKNIDFIKIDTEGFEIMVLKGMSNVLKETKPVLWVEVSEESFNEVFILLKENGYTVVDIEGFNVLFIEKTKTDGLETIVDEEFLMHNMFNYLKKVNLYYNNYIKTKGQLSNKNEQAKKYLDNYEKLNEKYKLSNENYQKVKEQLAKNKEELVKNKEELVKSNAEIARKRIELSKKENELVELKKAEYISNQEQIEMLTELKNRIKRLETQNNYLKSQNAEYQRKMQMIKDTFVGKILAWGYKLYKKIKAKLK